jgi:predicted nucleic acid-binding protein
VLFLDTSVVVDAFTGSRHSAETLLRLAEQGEQMALPALVLFEWLRGPRTSIEIRDQETLFPNSSAIPFEHRDAVLSAQLYRSVRRARSREIDIAIAACAIRHDALLWTLNRVDFADIPGLRLFRSKA